uniref:Heme transporter protein HuxB n=1 Tax=uncultured beta proteobacterium TaxID=86027 RepID=A0A871Y7B9_9PROT|nr:Heme transporter protein HuxB [uncultured beta proteobacterium]
MRILCLHFCPRVFALTVLLWFAKAGWAQPIQYPPDRAGQLMQQLQNDPALKGGTQPALPKLAPPNSQPLQPAAVAPGEDTFLFKSVVLSGNTLVNTSQIELLLAPWLGKNISLAQLQQAVAQISALYRDQGWLAQATLPDQDVSDGHVKVTVIEGKLGEVILQLEDGKPQLGAWIRRRIPSLIQHYMPIGKTIYFNDMDKALLLAGDLPGTAVSGSLQAGKVPGTSDLLVKVDSTPMVVGQVSTDNMGSRSTGVVRLNAQVQLNSPLGTGEQFSFSGSKNAGSTYVHAGVSTPVGIEEWRGLIFNAEASRMDYRILDQYKPDGARLRPEGHSNVLGVNLVAPWVRSANTNLSLNLGLEYRKALDKSDLEVPGTLGIVRNTQVNNRSLSMNFSHLDGIWGGGNNLLGWVETGGTIRLGPSGAASLDATEGRTQGSFQKRRITASRLQFIDGKHAIFMSASRQWASKNLDSSEKLYLGGASGVRAFPNSEAGGSSGLTATLELRREWSAQWQTTLFYDYGRISQFKVPVRADGTSLLNGASNDIMLRGRGVAMTYRFVSGAEVKATLARRVSPNPQPSSTGTDNDGTLRLNRFWLNVSMPF